MSDPCKFILDFLPGQCLEQVSEDVAMLITLCLADAKRRVFYLGFFIRQCKREVCKIIERLVLPYGR